MTTHNFLGPESHLGMAETMMAIKSIRVIDKTMSMVCFALDCYLKLSVGSELCVGFSIRCWWWYVIFTTPLL